MRTFLRRLYDDFLGDATWTAKFVAVGFASVYLLVALQFGGTERLFWTAVALVCPLAFIFWADYFESFRGWGNLRLIDQTTPAVFIRGAGWFFLLLPPMIFAVRLILNGLNK